ncbi:helix-turn-helix domain-containing protein [Paenibacillus elgii]
MSTATLAKLGKDEYVSLEIIDKICTHFDVQPNDIMEHKKDR